MAVSLVHLPCPQKVHIQVFKKNKKRNVDCDSVLERQNNSFSEGSADTNSSLSLEQSFSQSFTYSSESTNTPNQIVECNDNFCHIRVKDKENVVHLTNLCASKWNELRIQSVLCQINPYWNDKKIKIYSHTNDASNLLTASIEFKTREYSQRAKELIQSNFHLFVNDQTTCIPMNNSHKTPNQCVNAIKLKLIKANYSCYGQTCIPLGFDLRSIIANYYNLHCSKIQTKLEYYHNNRAFDHIPTSLDVQHFLQKCTFPPSSRKSTKSEKSHKISKKLILSVYFPFISLSITHQNSKYFVYVSGDKLSLYQLNCTQSQCIQILNRTISPSSIPSLLYMDILSLIDQSGQYTFYDPNNSNFECDLFSKIAKDFKEDEIELFTLETMQLPKTEDLDRCAICLNEVNESEFCRISCCKHLFHYECIRRLLHNDNNINEQIWDNELDAYTLCNFAHCPLCRRKFTSIQSRICNQSNVPTVQYIDVVEVDLIDDAESANEDEEGSDFEQSPIFDEDASSEEEDYEDDEDGVE